MMAARKSAPADPVVGTMLRHRNGWVFHNTSPEAIEQMMRDGFMDCGSFADRCIDFGRTAWIAARLSDIEPYSAHQYGDSTAFEAHWEVRNPDSGEGAPLKVKRTIPTWQLVEVKRNGVAIRRLGPAPTEWAAKEPMPALLGDGARSARVRRGP
ncbi:hypothetical protein [Oleiharenicola sp. Vm1]|uniref:hypothetical protein n=1 Tax=Oleiharenicola sp. Vm1 TaxID=3398393 RepID=UPI0039F47578